MLEISDQNNETALYLLQSYNIKTHFFVTYDGYHNVLQLTYNGPLLHVGILDGWQILKPSRT